MRVFFDHNVPHKLRRSLPGHQVRTADEMGWDTLENGQLLKTAEDAAFAVMVTADKNLSYQQKPPGSETRFNRVEHEQLEHHQESA